MRQWLLLLLVWVKSYCVAQDVELPEKGDGECLSLAERNELFRNGEDPSVWLYPCETEDDDTIEVEVTENGFALQLFSSLPAFGSDYGT